MFPLVAGKLRKTKAIAAVAASVVAAGSAATLAVTRRKQRVACEQGKHVPAGPYEAVFKRPLGAAIAAGSLVVLSPVIAATAIAVRLNLGSPVVFAQERPGLDAKPFKIYKFRTMTDERDSATGELLPDDVRLTKFGRLLRATSLDELPELVNILKGDMSLIGPRPLLMSYLPLYNEEQASRHDVRPGMTGLAQIRGRNSISWEEKFGYDIDYVNNLTLKTDLSVFFKTFEVLFTRVGISSRTSLTMEAFTGTAKPVEPIEDMSRTGDSQEGKPSIWILNHYATNTFFERNGRHYMLSKYLVKAGYRVTVFCASTVHNSDKNVIHASSCEHYIQDTVDGITYVFIKARSYKGNGKARILNMLDYYRGVMEIEGDFSAPDVIIGSSVHPLACYAAVKLSRRKGCKNIVEIRDLWPLSLEAYGVIPNGGVIACLLYRLERYLYENADALVFTMQGGSKYISDKQWDFDHGGKVDLSKVHNINNGVDLPTFAYNAEKHPLDCKEFHIDDAPIVMYTGSIRRVNNLARLVEVAAVMRDENVRFIVFGDGDELPGLREWASKEGLDKIHFMGRIAKEQVPSALSQADIVICLGSPVEVDAVAGYGNSNNKLFEYFASGKPLLYAYRSNPPIIEELGCGIEQDFVTAEGIAKEIRYMLADDNMRDIWSANSKAAAYEFSYERLAKRLVEIIEQITKEAG